jgi:hypothetical protein
VARGTSTVITPSESTIDDEEFERRKVELFGSSPVASTQSSHHMTEQFNADSDPDLGEMEAYHGDGDRMEMWHGTEEEYNAETLVMTPNAWKCMRMRQAPPLVPAVPTYPTRGDLDFIEPLNLDKLCVILSCACERAPKQKFCQAHTKAVANVKREYWANGDFMDPPIPL